MTRHIYMARESNGVRDATSCIKCGLPEVNTNIHEAVLKLDLPILDAKMTRTGRVLEHIRVERARQDKKFGPQDHNTDLFWLGIEGEEFAEMSQRFAQVCRLVLHPKEQRVAHGPESVVALRDELIQVAAVAVAWIEGIDTRFTQQRR